MYVCFLLMLLRLLSSLLKFNSLMDSVRFSLYLSSLGFVESLWYLTVYLYKIWKFSRHWVFFFQFYYVQSFLSFWNSNYMFIEQMMLPHRSLTLRAPVAMFALSQVFSSTIPNQCSVEPIQCISHSRYCIFQF